MIETLKITNLNTDKGEGTMELRILKVLTIVAYFSIIHNHESVEGSFAMYLVRHVTHFSFQEVWYSWAGLLGAFLCLFSATVHRNVTYKVCAFLSTTLMIVPLIKTNALFVLPNQTTDVVLFFFSLVFFLSVVVINFMALRASNRTQVII